MSENQLHTSPALPAVEATADAAATADEARADNIMGGIVGDPSGGGQDVPSDPADILQPVEDSLLTHNLNQGHLLDVLVTDHTEVKGSDRDTDCCAAPTGRFQEATACLTRSSSILGTDMPHCNGDVTQQEEEAAAAEWELVGEGLEGEAGDVIDSEEYVLL
ncbi:MAG: hypothetical protein WDW38_011177 [Sanguina aurantia]